MEEQLKALQVAFEDKIKMAASKDELASIKKELAEQIANIKSGVTDEQLKAAQDDFNEKLKAQWEEVKKLTPAKEDKPMTLRESFKQAIINSGQVEEYIDVDGDKRYRVKNAGDRNLDFRIKSAVDMNTANAVRPGATPGVNIGYLTDYGMMGQQLPASMNEHFLGVFSAESIAEKYYGVLVETDETDGAALKAETAAAGDSSYLWKTIEYKVFDFSVKFRVHQNTLDDIENVLNRISTIGVDRLLSVIDTNTLNAAGDNSATPAGLLTANYFTAYNTSLRAGTVQAANVVNVIKNAVLQAAQSDEMVDAVVMNRTLAAEIEDLKDGENNTVNLAGVKVDATGKLAYIYGLRVVINNKLAENKFIVLKLGESVQYGLRKQIGLRMGYDQTTDFSKNIVTVQLDARLAIGLGKPSAIIYCSDVTAAAAALTTVQA